MKLYSCPACGGFMEWDGESGGLKCRNCGTKQRAEDSAPSGWHHYGTLPGFPGLQDLPERDVRCPGCGAGIKTDAKAVSAVCPCCGAGIVLDRRQLSFARPDGAAPVRIRGDRVRLLIKEWCARHPLAPDLTSKYLEVKFISPQYIPFWVFSARVTAKYSGRGGRNRTVRERNAQGQTVSRTAVDWHPIDGTVSAELESSGVPGDRDIDGSFSDFLYSSTPQDSFRAWQPEYFAGSWSCLPTVQAGDAEAAAHDGMIPEIKRRTVTELSRKWSHIDFRTFSVSFSDTAWRLVQIPAYFVICRYHGGIYVEAVNGVTGEIRGTCPASFLRGTVSYAIAAAVMLSVFLFADYGSCGGRGCLTESGSILTDALIAAVIAAGVWVLIYIALMMRVLGTDDLKKSPWLRGIMEKTG